MFEQVILPQGQGRKKWTVALALAGQLLVVGALVALPMLLVQPLPMADLTSMLIAPPPPPPPPPPPAAVAPRTAPHVAPRHFDANALVQPHVIPKSIPVIQDLPDAAVPAVADAVAGVPGGVPGGQVGGQVGGVLGGILGAVPALTPAPPPPPPQAVVAAPKPPAIIRVGGAVEAARVLSSPVPVYPAIAKSAHVQGKVRLDAVIDKNGHIENLTLVSGNPLLVNAAMAAVKQWTYRPTYLNGQPVKIATQIDVNFELSS